MRLTPEVDSTRGAVPAIRDEPGPSATVIPAGPSPGGPPALTPAPTALERRVLDELRARGEPLFALLDAARDPLVLARLIACEEEHQSLYDGPKGERLADVAPYLVALPEGTPFLETVVREGWGRSWGVYLTSERPFGEVRKHLRRSLTVETEDGKKLLFRFYDPRVLRTFLPTCTPEEAAEFFGPITAYLMESGARETLLIFARDRWVADPAEVALTTAPGDGP